MAIFGLATFRAIGLAVAVVAGPVAAARAADLPADASTPWSPIPPTGDHWTFAFAPYLWGAGLKGDVQAFPRVPDVFIDASFQDILNHLKFTAMFATELRTERYGFLTDLFLVDTSVSKSSNIFPRIPGSTSARLDADVFSTTVSAFYAVTNSPAFEFDVLAGARVWWLDTNVSVTIATGRTFSADSTVSWIDPIVGARARINFNDRLSATLYGDYGGFDLGAQYDWQAVGLLNYSWNKHWTASGGYRYLSVDYRHGGHVWDVDMSGPIGSIGYRF